MLRRSVLALAKRPPLSTSTSPTTTIFRMASTSTPTSSQTPMEDVMREKLTANLTPSHLQIHNDSHLHSHHKAMAGSTSQETHFRVFVTSEAFRGKMQPARHRMVYALLKEEMSREGGIHALQLKTKTREEEEREAARAEEGKAIVE